jgi:DNA repair protein RadC
MPVSRFEFMFNHLEKDNSMQALEKLGLVLDEPIGLSELLSEDFNPQLYRLTEAQEEKINALKDVVAAYISAREDIAGKTIKDSGDAAEIAGDKLRRLGHEELWVAFLNRANVVMSFEMLFKGALDSVIISHRDIIAKALSKRAANIILFHNHPSGCPTPGTSDIEHTRLLQKACKMMEIGMLDHIIVSQNCYFSFADERTTKFKTR